jgi:YVTN family beta-propeller protein
MRLKTPIACVAVASLIAACSGKDPRHPDDDHDTGGKPGAGGQTSTGGKPATGGKAGTGGKPGTGGAQETGGVSNGDDGGEAPGAVLGAPSRGAPLVMSDDELTAVVTNRDSGSVTVLSVDYLEGGITTTKSIGEVKVGDGSEPWQAVIAPDNDTAFVVLRKDQKLVRIRYLTTKPVVDGYAYVGSEPTSVALSPSGKTAYVANWTDGTVSVIDAETLEAKDPIDLNETLVKSGYLGKVDARPALAHPRSITVTNDGDTDDDDETVLVTEYFSQQIAELQSDGSNADVARAGVVYKIAAKDYSSETIRLSPITDIGFKDSAGGVAGCFPNQLQSVTLNGKLAYVVSVCAAPEGPEGLKVTTKECQTVTDCQGDDLKLVDPVCDVVAFGKPKVCQDVAGFKTATSPVISVIDVEKGAEVLGAARNLNSAFDVYFEKIGVKDGAKRFPLFARDLAFVPGTGVGYVTANAIDSVFRVVYDVNTGELKDVGAGTSPFIVLNPADIKAGSGGKGPIGIAIGAANKKFALVANDITRNVQALDFNTQAIAGGVKTPSVTLATALPEKNSDADHVLAGKDLFNTGRARWSLNGEGWGACQSCHSDGLTDNVTWFFGRGPRQSISLDGTFASKNSLDQRILNHTATRDELADFDGNTKATSGGVGAIVLAKSNPPDNHDRIDTTGLKLAELDGSSLLASDPANPLGLGFDQAGKVVVGQTTIDPNAKPAGGQLEDWKNITRYVQTIRTPRAPSNLDAKMVSDGEKLFGKLGSCQGCHGGDKWTVSKLFYTPNVANTAALKTTPFDVPAGFPAGLLPAQDPQDRKLVINAGGESVQCVLRNVDTFKKAEPGVGIAEVRGTNMKDLAQGGGVALRPNADGDNNADNDPKAGIGYNVPSLLGVATGAPFMHAGNARTLEAMLTSTFAAHTNALAPNFLLESNPDAVKAQVDELVQYLLSIDEDKAVQTLPLPGAQGGALCPETFTAPPPAPPAPAK